MRRRLSTALAFVLAVLVSSTLHALNRAPRSNPDGRFTAGRYGVKLSAIDAQSASGSATAPSPTPAPTPTPQPSSCSATSTGHPYFDRLTAHAGCWKSYSLRDSEQLNMYAQSQTRRKWVTYDATMDAAKVTIPDFDPDFVLKLAESLDASATTVHISGATDRLLSGAMTTGRALNIGGSEIVVVQRVSGVAITGGLVPVKRAASPVAHTEGETILGSVNSVLNQVRLPLGTEDGHTYLFTWDSWQSASLFYRNTGIAYFKTWQFSNANKLWLEIASRYDGTYGNWAKVPGWNGSTDVASIGLRSYNKPGGRSAWSSTTSNFAGPGVTATGSAAPQIAPFIVKPDRWVRYWVQIDQRANDYDFVSMWAADAEVGPVLLVDRLALSLPANANSIQTFWLEYNTSYNPTPAGRGSLTFYARNFVALRDVTDVSALLVKPISTK